ncbi:hypothetical protein F0U62_19190 [Cystobacter fuscus]|uniref:hypothetical protein n=1 Tax=Cystobacter fuscus TaxID=43 RepID=UPI002B2D3849|nr:hypothetical protein F0U62_19190 [Cystobacter fuscus]
MRRALALAVLGGVLAACRAPKPSNLEASGASPSSRYAPAEDVPGCRLYGEPQAVGRVPLVLAEMSGLAASVRHPGVLWAHNDSGNAFQVFAIDETGKPLATLTLTGADPEDMDLEDIALGPCAPGDARTCVYLADTGDNFERREQVRLLRFPEPEQVTDATLAVEELPFTWPDRAHDCEALVIEPGTGRPVLITKEGDSLGEVFALQGLAPGSVARASHLGTLRSPGNVDRRTTAAALHPSGQRLLLRTYTRVWEVRRPGASRMEELIQGPVVEVPGASQAQSEAITWLPGDAGADRSYLIGSEFAGQRLYRVDCR